MANLVFQLLNKKKHDRAAFDCREPALNLFLQKHANQDIGNNKSRTFVCVDSDNQSEILGYYTLVYEHINLELLPANKRRGFAGNAPVLLIARLAVDVCFQNQGLGRFMLMDTFKKFLIAYEVGGGAGIAVNAKNQRVADYYANFGFIAAPDDPLTLFLPVTTIKAAL
jgi:GNAT superfamily N-acetyltransferase